ncbi:MAG: PBP1A family penicillin-binding protein, partial [Bdellovibrionales bacterium]|nr:PBP1A family penicillin-binding protein [Bdellovibrionales bacterium]
MLRKFFIFLVIITIPVLLAGGLFATWGYYYITRDLPRLNRVEDYRPIAASTVFAQDGTPIAEFFEERRYPATIDEIPVFVRNAFLAAEDASFYKHKGIDLVSIFRALVKNIQSGSARQGGSTITQQVVKNLLLTSEKKLTRKVKEAILAYQIENRLSKDDILQIYLNQIFFGNGAYGIKAASRIYFHKEIGDLSLGEAALLAGLPKAPSGYSPITSPKRAKNRQRYVLDQMVRAGFVTADRAADAVAEELQIYKVDNNNFYAAPYFAGEVRRIFDSQVSEQLKGSLEQHFTGFDLDRGGYAIYTSVDTSAQAMATQALRVGVREVDKRQGWRGPIGTVDGASVEEFRARYKVDEGSDLDSIHDVLPALVTGVDPQTSHITFYSSPAVQGELNLKSAAWAKKQIRNDKVVWEDPIRTVRVGDVVEIEVRQGETPEGERAKGAYELSQTPTLEGALVLIHPSTGEIVAMVGGYSYGRSKFNRVTQAYRQPGSSFKPIVYLAAVDEFGYTPATIVRDEPRIFKIGDTTWSPGNFDNSYLGDITLRNALEKSRNLVSADIISRIGVSAAIEYARKLGIESPLGRNLSLSLGSSEVTLLEITRAYGVFANRGVLLPSTFVRKIVDRDQKTLFDVATERLEQAHAVVSPESAFILAYMMKGVVERGTGWRVRELKRPVAGKTGTSNDLMDAWFVGYTPEWSCGVWVGFDLKKTIGPQETGGRVSSPIWLDFMRKFLEYQDNKKLEQARRELEEEEQVLGVELEEPAKIEPLDFIPPEGVHALWVNSKTGRLTDPSDPDAFYEYFVKGAEP